MWPPPHRRALYQLSTLLIGHRRIAGASGRRSTQSTPTSLDAPPRVQRPIVAFARSAERSCYFRNATFKTTSRGAKTASSAQPNGCELLGGRGDGSHQTRYRYYEPAEPDGSCMRRSRSSNACQAAPDPYRQPGGRSCSSPSRTGRLRVGSCAEPSPPTDSARRRIDRVNRTERTRRT